jgi:hypothetical protein
MAAWVNMELATLQRPFHLHYTKPRTSAHVVQDWSQADPRTDLHRKHCDYSYTTTSLVCSSRAVAQPAVATGPLNPVSLTSYLLPLTRPQATPTASYIKAWALCSTPPSLHHKPLAAAGAQARKYPTHQPDPPQTHPPWRTRRMPRTRPTRR